MINVELASKTKMTHNEFKNFLEANASKIFNNSDYGYEQYSKDADSIEVLPFNLQSYNIPVEQQTVINNTFTEDTTGSQNEYMLKGFSQDEDDWYSITNKLNLKRVAGYYYSGYCYNTEFNMYMTYCEGDLYLHLFKTELEYSKAIKETIVYYENED